jgi:hypothetical protein
MLWEPSYKNPQTQIHLAFTSQVYVWNSYSKESSHEIKLNFKRRQEIQIINSGSKIDSKICYSGKKNCLCEIINDHICWSANFTSREANIRLINEKVKLWMKWMHIISLSMDVCVISLWVIDIFHFGKTLEFKLAKWFDFNQRILCENDCPNLTNLKEKRKIMIF